MTMPSTAVRAGVRRGLIEFRKSLRAPEDLTYFLFGTAVFVFFMYINRDNELRGTGGLTSASFMFPGVLAFIIIFAGAFGLATQVTTEREDGTLLRMKSLPHGMAGYVVGQATRTSVEVLFNIVILTVPAMILLDSLWLNGPAGALHVAALVVLGLLACIPLGFAIGSVFKNPRAVGGWGLVVVSGLVAVSGIFFPVVALPEWAHGLIQLTPLYWLGLGMREATLPDGAVVAELGESWRTLETFGALGAWAVAGLLLAPVLLRRMARRESGSSVAQRQQEALQRV